MIKEDKILESHEHGVLTQTVFESSEKYFGWAWSKTKDHFAAQEILQELFELALKADSNNQEVQNPKSYINRCCWNLITNYLKKQFQEQSFITFTSEPVEELLNINLPAIEIIDSNQTLPTSDEFESVIDRLVSYFPNPENRRLVKTLCTSPPKTKNPILQALSKLEHLNANTFCVRKKSVKARLNKIVIENPHILWWIDHPLTFNT